MLRSLVSSMWPNQLTVSLSTHGVAAINRLHGLSRRVLTQQHVSITPNTDEPVWQHATSKLESLIASTQVKPKTQLRVVLSSDFVRYLILPPQQISMNLTEKLSYAIAAYRDVYGAVTDGWDIKLHDAAPNQSIIVAAVDKNLLETLSQIALKYQLKLVSVQPYLMSAFNSLRNQLGKTNGYLVILESGRLLVISMHQGQYQNLRISVAGDDWKTELQHSLVRHSLLNGDEGREVLIYAPAQKITSINNFEGWNTRLIGQTHKKIFSDSHFTLLETSA